MLKPPEDTEEANNVTWLYALGVILSNDVYHQYFWDSGKDMSSHLEFRAIPMAHLVHYDADQS